jgi:uncharacterized membrane protein YhaH (DUF805 family)
MAGDPLRLTWWKLWFRWRGRIGREWFWLGYIMIAIIGGAANAAVFVLKPPGIAAIAASALVGLLTLYTFLSVAIKRLHDRGKSGWWIILYYFVPGGFIGPAEKLRVLFPEWWWISPAIGGLIFLWALIELGFLRGKGPNRYGEGAMDEPAIEPPTRPPPVKSES